VPQQQTTVAQIQQQITLQQTQVQQQTTLNDTQIKQSEQNLAAQYSSLMQQQQVMIGDSKQLTNYCQSSQKLITDLELLVDSLQTFHTFLVGFFNRRIHVCLLDK